MTVEPIPAASVLVLRDDPFEVLMIQRHEKSSFVPSAWVFPGGAVDPVDGAPGTLDAARNAAIREVFEETAIRLEGEL
ncbi:MAG TPA: NUDIX domain-containing protein, partial [Thermoanaerobaculia bacterium]